MNEKFEVSVNEIHRLFPAPSFTVNHKGIEEYFNSRFSEKYKTVLKGGFPEPFYRPNISPTGKHLICYREDFVASALHEIAHWCLAGKRRLMFDDFGYSYNPIRDSKAQAFFYEKEARPQALEYIFHTALRTGQFNLSIDNFNLDQTTEKIEMFKKQVGAETCKLLNDGLPHRANLFLSQQ